MTKIADLPFDFTIGNRNAAKGDKATLIFNPKNDRLLFDFDGKGGDKAVKVGKIDADVDVLLPLIHDLEVVFGNRHSAETDHTTVIFNFKNGNILADLDGNGSADALKIGRFDLDL